MRAFRCIPLSLHAVIELTVGLALILSAFALDLGVVGAVLAFASGAVLAGLGLGTADALPLASHQSLDRGLAIALAVASLGAAAAGDGAAALMLFAAGVVQLVLTGITRWTRVPAAG